MNDSGLPGVTLDDRDHVCVFYRGSQERDEVLSAYFGAGYAEGDKCLCIADDHDVEAVADRLDPEGRRRPDQLTVLPATAYLTDGRFVPDRVYEQWDSMLGGYVADGYRRVRGSGELSWFLRDRRAAADGCAGPLLEYEELCNRLVKRRPATIFCLYDLDLLDAGLLPGVLRRHPTALARGVLFRSPLRSADDALSLANLLVSGARSEEEIQGLLDGIRAAVVDVEDGSELTRALLEGDPLDAAARAEVGSLGLDLDAPFRAVVARRRNDLWSRNGDIRRVVTTKGQPPISLAELRALGVRLAAVRAGEVAILAGDGPALDSILELLGGPTTAVGVGRPSTNAAGAARSYAEARSAADFAATLGRPVVKHEELGFFSLLADGGDPEAMIDFAAEWLGPLLDHDAGRRPRQHLLPTLAAYLDHGAAQQATADSLGIHVSSLKYRLGRIGEIAGRDLSRPDLRFQLQVALAAHRTLSVLRTDPQGD